jgi:prefoldin subunit 5
MSPQDIMNISQWLQQLIKDVQDTHQQMLDMRGEIRAANDELKNLAGRAEQKNADLIRLVESLKGQLDIIHGETGATKSVVEAKIASLENTIKDLRSDVHEVRNKVR